MSLLVVAGLLVLGIMAGYLSGLVGIGGGIVLVPALVYVFGMSQHEAQGTTLALMIPPIGILAVMEYYKKQYVNVSVAAIIIVGFVLGSYFGGRIATAIPDYMLKRIFAVLLIVIAIKMIFFDKSH
jgi:uncharacterized membrane protein YfcA